MAGPDSGFGAGGSPVPVDPSEDHGDSAFLPDDEQEMTGEQDPFGEPMDADEIPRNTRPFRAWGAAHEDRGPTLWERFKAWLGRVFRRDRDAAEDDSTEAVPDDFHDAVAPLTEASLDAEGLSHQTDVADEPHPAAVEPPMANDFGEPWRHNDAPDSTDTAAEEQAPPTGDPDPLWDAPRVSQASSAPREVIDHGALNVVWTPPTSDSGLVVGDLEQEVEEMNRPSFIARLFARRKKRQEVPDEESSTSEPTAAEVEPAPSDFADAPSHDDFAETTAVAEPEVEEPEVEEPEVEEPEVEELRAKPSLDHSAEDAAALASFLASGPPVEARTDEELELEATVPMEAAVEESVEAVAEADIDEMPAEEPQAQVDSFSFLNTSTPEPEAPVVETSFEEMDVAPEAPTPIEAEVEEQPLVEEPVAEAAEEPVTEEVAEEPEKKPGFFARLFRRKSKPVDEIEPIEAEAEATVAEEPVVEEETPGVEVEETDSDELARREAEDARWAPPAAIEEPALIEPEPAEPTPYPPFVDARDDEPEPVEAVETGRKTEEIDQPVLDPFAEGEKTDEFEVVPPPSAADAATAAMPATPAPAGFLGRLFGKKDDDEDTLETTGQMEPVPAPQMAAPTATLAHVPSPKDEKLPFVLLKFRMFYNEIIRDKHQKSDVISGFATAIVSGSESQDADPDFAAALLSKRLSEMLELQAAEANWTGGDAVKYYPEAQYAMVCLADETFLTIDWPGRPSWHKHMLEPRMYSTRAADTELFRRIDKLLREPNPPRGARDLARVYLLVIASGFRGIFREPNLKRPLAEYRRRLYEYSHNEDPLELYARDRKIFPEAEKYILAGKAVGRFTAAQKWAAAVILLLVVYGTVSHLAWKRLSADLRDVVARIESTIGPGGAR